jgi:hypothetical protein
VRPWEFRVRENFVLSNPSQTHAKALQRRGAIFIMTHCNVIGNFAKSFAPIRQQT